MTIKLTKVVEQVEEFDVVYAKNLRTGMFFYWNGSIAQVYSVQHSRISDDVYLEYMDEHRNIKSGLCDRHFPFLVKIQ
jgi:hypothetical protein